MKEIIATASAHAQERALLVSLACEGDDRWERADSLGELAELVRSAGGEVAASVTQRRASPTAPCYIGRGKAQELARTYPKNTAAMPIIRPVM